MRYESLYFNKSFKPFLLKRLILPACVGLIFSIMLASSFHHQRADYGFRYSDYERFIDAINGLPYFGMKELLTTIIIFVCAIIISAAAIYHDNKSMKMIVGIEMDDSKKITIYTKDFFDKLKKVAVRSDVLKIEEVLKQKDGILNDKYTCHLFKRNGEIIGRFFIYHYTWEDETKIEEIKNEIKKRK